MSCGTRLEESCGTLQGHTYHPDYLLPTVRKDNTGKNKKIVLKYVPPTPLELYKKTPQSQVLAYKCEATFCNALLVLVKNGWLTRDDTTMVDTLNVLCNMNPEYESIIESVPKLMNVDFSALLEPRYDYADQPEIKKERVRLMAACTVHYDLDFGLVLRFLAGEYTGEWRDVEAVITDVKPHIYGSNKKHIFQILTNGCPTKLV